MSSDGSEQLDVDVDVDKDVTADASDAVEMDVDLSGPTSAGRRAQQLYEMTTCDGFCNQEVLLLETVDVAVGEHMGTWNSPEAHVGLKGVDGGHPLLEEWCLDCAEAQFEVTEPAGERAIDTARQYLTASNIVAFGLGLILGLLALSVFTV